MSKGGSVAVVLGTRPEIVKLASVVRGLGDRARLVYTGQHYDDSLAGSFFRSLRMPPPHLSLDGIGGASRGRQIGAMISALSDHFAADPPRAVVVQGDTNSTSAGAQAAHYHGVPVVHVEAGLRSRDRQMPEEINRQVVGVIADAHCVPTTVTADNLRAEGVPDERIHLTGNTIVEAVAESLPSPAEAAALLRRYGVREDRFVLATIHRPENTDDPERLALILAELGALGLPVLLPLHPRTRGCVVRYGLQEQLGRLLAIDPIDHAAFLGLAGRARLLISDSGGVQEECTVLKKPLIVLRNSTERPEAVEAGFATLLRPGPAVGELARRLIADTALPARLAALPSPYGDGRAGERIVELTLALAGARTPTLAAVPQAVTGSPRTGPVVPRTEPVVPAPTDAVAVTAARDPRTNHRLLGGLPCTSLA